MEYLTKAPALDHGLKAFEGQAWQRAVGLILSMLQIQIHKAWSGRPAHLKEYCLIVIYVSYLIQFRIRCSVNLKKGSMSLATGNMLSSRGSSFLKSDKGEADGM